MTTNALTPMNDGLTALQQAKGLYEAGAAANAAAARHAFTDYRQRKSANTLRAHDTDLALFADFLRAFGHAVEGAALAADPGAWHGVTWGLVEGFVRWQLQQGYAIASVNRRLSTVKKYAALAAKAGALDTTERALIRDVAGYSHKEAKKVDEKRQDAGQDTRRLREAGRPVKKAEHVSIPPAAAKRLKREQPDTPQGRRDAVLMCLLLDHGLRCGEVAGLTVGAVNLAEGTLTFYRPKVDKVQQHRLTKDTRAALLAYERAGDMPMTADTPLLRASRKSAGDELTHAGMSARAITKRVRALGQRAGLEGLSAHDCRHYWATTAAKHKTDPFRLQEAGGWNSLAMPRRYVEAARIANEGVSLGDD